MNEIKFRRDTSFRKQFFVPDSFAHPAKMDAQLLIWIVSKYTASGETIEKLCPKFLNTSPKLEYEDVLVFSK